jgi:hypothetical protein
MSNIPISSLPIAVALSGSEAVPMVQAGTTKTATVSLINSVNPANVPVGGLAGQALVKTSNVNYASSGTTVASIDLVGSYVTSDFKLSAGSGGSGTIITDPKGGQGSLTIAGGSVLDINPATQVALSSQCVASVFPDRGAIQQTSLLSDVHAPPTPLLTTPGHA